MKFQGFEELRNYIDTWTDTEKDLKSRPSIQLEKELYHSMKDLADREGTNVRHLVSEVLQKYVEDNARERQ